MFWNNKRVFGTLAGKEDAMQTEGDREGMAVPASRLLSLEALEERSNVSRYTWRLWLRQGKLPAVRLGRRLLVDQVDYEAFIRQNRKSGR